jgi:hypothetical protein
VTDRDEHLLGEIARRNWLVLAILVLLSLAWRSPAVSAGVLAGGLVAIGAYHWLHRTLRKLLATPGQTGAGSYNFGYLIRLGTLATVLLLLIAVVRVNPVALAAGLSTVVLNLLWTAIKRLNPTRRQ